MLFVLELKEEVVTQIEIQENIIPVEIIPVQMVSSGYRFHIYFNVLLFIVFVHLLIIKR